MSTATKKKPKVPAAPELKEFFNKEQKLGELPAIVNAMLDQHTELPDPNEVRQIQEDPDDESEEAPKPATTGAGAGDEKFKPVDVDVIPKASDLRFHKFMAFPVIEIIASLCVAGPRSATSLIHAMNLSAMFSSFSENKFHPGLRMAPLLGGHLRSPFGLVLAYVGWNDSADFSPVITTAVSKKQLSSFKSDDCQDEHNKEDDSDEEDDFSGEEGWDTMAAKLALLEPLFVRHLTRGTPCPEFGPGLYRLDEAQTLRIKRLFFTHAKLVAEDYSTGNGPTYKVYNAQTKVRELSKVDGSVLISLRSAIDDKEVVILESPDSKEYTWKDIAEFVAQESSAEFLRAFKLYRSMTENELGQFTDKPENKRALTLEGARASVAGQSCLYHAEGAPVDCEACAGMQAVLDAQKAKKYVPEPEPDLDEKAKLVQFEEDWKMLEVDDMWNSELKKKRVHAHQKGALVCVLCLETVGRSQAVRFKSDDSLRCGECACPLDRGCTQDCELCPAVLASFRTTVGVPQKPKTEAQIQLDRANNALAALQAVQGKMRARVDPALLGQERVAQKRVFGDIAAKMLLALATAAAPPVDSGDAKEPLLKKLKK